MIIVWAVRAHSRCVCVRTLVHCARAMRACVRVPARTRDCVAQHNMNTHIIYYWKWETNEVVPVRRRFMFRARIWSISAYNGREAADVEDACLRG